MTSNNIKVTICTKNAIEDIELAENEYYYSDIIGSTVFDNDNQPIGRVINILKQVQMMFGLLKEKRNISFLI